jgi:hypothetical protein
LPEKDVQLLLGAPGWNGGFFDKSGPSAFLGQGCSQGADASDEVLKIPRRNIETMRDLGQEQILKRLQTLGGEQ